MRTIDEGEAQACIGDILDQAQRQPVAICRQGREIAIVLSMADYERFRVAVSSEFLALRDDIAREASSAGLTEDGLAELLSDD